MQIKTIYFIFEKYLEKIHPNNATENEDVEEDIEEIATDLTNDYDYLCECARRLVMQINAKINEIKPKTTKNNQKLQ